VVLGEEHPSTLASMVNLASALQERRSTKSLVLGKAKVMSYEDLEEARAKRDAKEAAKAKGKGRRVRKRKSPEAEAEADTPVPKAKVARMSEAPEPKGPSDPDDIMERDWVLEAGSRGICDLVIRTTAQWS